MMVYLNGRFFYLQLDIKVVIGSLIYFEKNIHLNYQQNIVLLTSFCNLILIVLEIKFKTFLNVTQIIF
jgi:hypothetical protein